MKMNNKVKGVIVSIVLILAVVFQSVNSKAIYGYDPAEIGVFDSFVFHIKPKNVQTKCMDVLNAYTSDGSVVWLYDMNINASCQEWKVERISGSGNDSIYKIQDCHSGKYLSIVDDSPQNNAGIEIRTYTGSNGQKFKIIKNNDNSFRILTGCSNYTKAIYYSFTYSAGGIDYYKLDQYTYLLYDNTCRWFFIHASNDRADVGVGIPDGRYLMHSSNYNKVAYFDTTDYVKIETYSTLDDNPCMLFRYNGNGYYTIKTGSFYLTGNTSTSNNEKVYWSTSFSGANTQLWDIVYNPSAKEYTIRSKNLVLANKSYYLTRGGLFQGYKLIQGSSSNNKWKLIVDEMYHADVFLAGIIDSDPDHSNHSKWMGDVANRFYSNTDYSCMFDYQADHYVESDIDDFADRIADSTTKIAIIRSHGGKEGTETFIRLDDKSTHSVSNRRLLTSSIVGNCDFSNAEIILYIGCSTAEVYNSTTSTTNLIYKSVNDAGCLLSVGFNDSIGCSAANDMADYFSYHYFYKLNNQYPNYNSLSISAQQDARIDCYQYAIKEAAITSGLTAKCVYYYSGSYYTCD